MTLPRQDEAPATPTATNQKVEESERAEAMSIADCKTPTAKEYRIPDAVTCPPAPRKPRVCPAVIKPKKIGDVKAFYVSLDLKLEELWKSK